MLRATTLRRSLSFGAAAFRGQCSSFSLVARRFFRRREPRDQLFARANRDEYCRDRSLTSCIQRGSAARKLDPGDDESVTALDNLALRSKKIGAEFPRANLPPCFIRLR